MAGQFDAAAAEAVADRVRLARTIGVALGLEARRDIAPAAGGRGENACSLAVPGRIGQCGGQRRQLDGAMIGQRGRQRVKAVGVEERGVGGPVEERRVAQHIDEEVAVGAHAVDAGARQRVGQHACGLTADRRVRDDLGQHRVVEHRHLRAVDDAGVDPNADAVEEREFALRSLGTSKRCTEPRLRLPVLGRVLGVQPGLDGIAARQRRLGVEVATVGDVQLQRDEVEAGGAFGDRVLDLQPGVHLEEEEVAGPVFGRTP